MSYIERFASSSMESSELTTQKKQTLKPNPLPKHSCQTDTLAPVSRFPTWLHRSLPKDFHLKSTKKELREQRLFTVCEEAHCPNILKCFSKKTATFLTLGKTCTRHCAFCSIEHSDTPEPPEKSEGASIVHAIGELGLKHVVLTMVARDDLDDGGAKALAHIMYEIHRQYPHVTIEVLTTDFNGNKDALGILLDADPVVFNHNIETVRRLSPRVRHRAEYNRSLSVLSWVHQNRPTHMKLKSGIMLGLGEQQEEVIQTLQDLAQVGCDIVTIGQYLQPTRKHLLVKRFVQQDEFDFYRDTGMELGIKHMYCGPFVRSSYNADLFIH